MSEIVNSEEVKRRIEEVCSALLPEALVRGLTEACQIVENDAVRNCPVDDGILKASLNYDVAQDGSNGIVGTNVEYAPYVHEGTGIYAKGGNGRQTPWTYKTPDGKYHTTEGQKPNPFLQDSLDTNMSNILQCFVGKLDAR